jgi:hypothetical protein
MLISLEEYAQLHGRASGTIRQRCIRGSFTSARKIGRNWVIDSEEPLIDNRVKNGKYKNWRKKQSDPSD